MDRWIDGSMNRWIDRSIDGSMDRWISKTLNESCSNRKMTIIYFVKHQKLITIILKLGKAMLNVVQKSTQNRARTHP